MKKMKSDTTLKLFAIFISLVLWSFVMRDLNPEIKRPYRVAVELTNKEALEKNGLVIMGLKEETIDINIIGKKFDWANFSVENDVKAYVDLSGYGEGSVKVPVQVSLKQLSKMQVVDYGPREILFNFDKIITKDKMVTIKTEGKLAAGYVLGDMETKSQFVSLKGPRSWVNEVTEIVANVNLEGRKEDINVTVAVKMIDDQGEDVMGISNEPSVIEVSIPVYKTTTVPIEIQTINELPENYEATDIDIIPSSVTLIGKESVSSIKFIQTKAIDINEFIENKTIEAELELPEGVKLLNPSEKIMVSLNVEEIIQKTFDYKINELELRNLNEDLDLDKEVEEQNIQITVKGIKGNIEELTKEDLEVYLDLNMIGAGEHEMYIGFNMPTGVTVETISPQPIRLKIINKG